MIFSYPPAPMTVTRNVKSGDGNHIRRFGPLAGTSRSGLHPDRLGGRLIFKVGGDGMAEFKPAFAFTLQHEDPGGTGKVTEDGGGRTRFGIAARFHPDLREEFFNGPAEDELAEAERFG